MLAKTKESRLSLLLLLTYNGRAPRALIFGILLYTQQTTPYNTVVYDRRQKRVTVSTHERRDYRISSHAGRRVPVIESFAGHCRAQKS